MFYFWISLKGLDAVLDTDDALSHRQRDVEGIVSLLKAVSYGFLKKHHLRPHKVDVSSNKSVFSTATRRSNKASTSKKLSSGSSSNRSSTRTTPSEPVSRSGTPFDGWHRRKIGLPTTGPLKRIKLDESKPAEPSEVEPERLIGEGGKLLRRPFDGPDVSFDLDRSQRTGCHETGTQSIMTGALSKEDYATSPAETVEVCLVGNKSDLGRKYLKRKRCGSQAKAEPSEWLQGILKSWNNPVFELAPSSVPRLSDESQAPWNSGTGLRCCENENGGVNFEAASLSLHGRVSREALSDAEVISQVDCKFILLRLPWRSMDQENTSSALVMLDQHAADERCRLEDLMAGYFKEDAKTGKLSAVVEALEQPLRFEVSDREGDLLGAYKEHFTMWGIIYNVRLQAKTGFRKEGDSCKLVVSALPPSILERCRGEPRLLVELMRKEIWKLNDEGITPSQSQLGGNASDGPCAIMFNDVLTKAECEDLHGAVGRSRFGVPNRGWDERGSAKGERATWKKWMEKKPSNG
ncbi:DNA mismatch repair Mlh3-like protein [Cladobotryum mycophilum]|uniref:DNA mismatch repair Mlh3-like protein n=1 Tax=Cladobotryum mycophilum TaxID=491253 RepID=A0ABR0SZZ2_9HYPO